MGGKKRVPNKSDDVDGGYLSWNEGSILFW
jgi:hypothetical protein